jgi:hypothetical protein
MMRNSVGTWPLSTWQRWYLTLIPSHPCGPGGCEMNFKYNQSGQTEIHPAYNQAAKQWCYSARIVWYITSSHIVRRCTCVAPNIPPDSIVRLLCYTVNTDYIDSLDKQFHSALCSYFPWTRFLQICFVCLWSEISIAFHANKSYGLMTKPVELCVYFRWWCIGWFPSEDVRWLFGDLPRCFITNTNKQAIGANSV